MYIASDSAPPRTWFLDLSPIRDSPAYMRFWTSGVAVVVVCYRTRPSFRAYDAVEPIP